MGVVAHSWHSGRLALNQLADSMPPKGATETKLEYERVSVTVLPGPGVIKGDFMDREDYDEIYVLPDNIPLIQMYDICKVLLRMK
jgi:hypothetical protein